MTNEERLDRLERVVHVLAEDQLSLQQLIAEDRRAAAENQRASDEYRRASEEEFRQVRTLIADLARHTNQQFDEVAARFRETDAGIRALGGRIDNLVSGIGEFIRRQIDK